MCKGTQALKPAHHNMDYHIYNTNYAGTIPAPAIGYSVMPAVGGLSFQPSVHVQKEKTKLN